MEKEPTNERRPSGRGKKWFIVLLVLVAVIGELIYSALPPKEPTYNGKPLTYWLTQYQSVQWADPKDPKKVESEEAIRHIGTNAIPTLLRMVQARDSKLKLTLMEWIDEHDYVHLHFTPAEVQNAMAVEGFQCLGDLATNCAQTLIDIYNHTPPQTGEVKQCANAVLMGMYLAPGVTNPDWVPADQRPGWFLEAGQIKNNLGEYSNATLAFSEAIKLEPTNAEAYDMRSSARMQLHDLPGSLSDEKKAIELNKQNEHAVLMAGFCEYGMKNYESADKYLTTAIELNTNEFSAYDFRGLARLNLRKVDEAMADFNKSINMMPNNPVAYRNRAAGEVMQKEYELALADSSRAVDLNGKDPYAYMVRGQVKCALKDYQSALEDFNRAVELNPKDANGYANRAAPYVYLDKFEDANANLEKAIAIEPKTMMIYVMRGVLKAKQGKDEEAVADLEHAVELSPKSVNAIAALGLFQYKASKPAALENCVKALRMGPFAATSELRAYIWLMRVQTGQDDQKKAANAELEDYLKTLPAAKTNEWEASIARFFSGNLAESNFLSQATTTAKRPSAIIGQVSESFYYAGMKRKLAGDTQGAREMFQKCLDKKDDNNFGYMNAQVEMRK